MSARSETPAPAPRSDAPDPQPTATGRAPEAGRPRIGIWATVVEPPQLLDFARRAEDLGLDSVWVPDHLVWPQQIASHYPYRGSGAPPVGGDVRLYDPWALLSAIAAVTTRIRLGTSVYVLPLRDPLVTARAVATTDLLSNGRVILGAGIGWMAEEFAAAGIPFGTRAARTEEIIPLLRRLWSEETIDADGEHVRFAPVHFQPKPPQGAALPIVLGGESPIALRRAARLCDGWLGTWHDPETARERVATLRRLVAASDRPDRPFEITVMLRPRDLDASRVEALLAAGADSICVGGPTVPIAAWPEILERTGQVLGALGD